VSVTATADAIAKLPPKQAVQAFSFIADQANTSADSVERLQFSALLATELRKRGVRGFGGSISDWRDVAWFAALKEA
jgi:hypothetical protein